MPSERIQRQIDALLDEADAAIKRSDWVLVRDRAENALRLDPENADAQAYVAAAQRPPASAAVPPHPTPSPQPPGPTSFCEGRYQVVRLLGEGGKKRVYLAHDTKLDRDVAFALIKTDGLDEEGLLRVKREAQAMGRLGDHPHIVSVFDIGDEAGQPYLVSQLMSGGDLEGLIEQAEDRRVSLDAVHRIADQVCQALEHAHSHGIVHRDLKPGNVWLTADGTAKIGDFGLALALDRSRLTQAGMMVGTVSYMPPEQALGGEVTPRSDLYSLGAMLYEMATGRPPFAGDESVAIITQHLNTPPVAPSWHVPDLPPGLEALILRLLEKDPAKRPGSAAEVRGLLAGARALSPTPPPTLREGQTSDDGSPLPKLGEGGAEGVSAVSQSLTPSPQNPLYRRTFVGREGELRRLQGVFDAAISGQGGLVMVVGEPGIGKTALCEQLATYVAMRGGKALVGHCYEEGSLSLPYLPFVEALRSYVLAREPEELRQELGSGAPDVARIISEIRDRVGLPPAPNPQTPVPAPDPDEERLRLLQAVTAFLRNAGAAHPLLIVLEDLHWADRGTLDLLTFASRQLAGARLLLVGTYRDVEVDRSHPLSSALAELRRGRAFERVSLRGLRVPEVQRMLEAIAGREVPTSLAEAVHRQTEGNPLFVQEVARYLVEEGLVSQGGRAGDGRISDTAPIAMAIPEGLRDVIGKRLSRLSAECNRALATAAVIGRDFSLDALQAVAPLAGEDLVAALEDAVRVGVLEEEARLGTVRYRFTHAFFRQTLYGELSAPRRIQLHQQVARALEEQYAARLDEHAAELAEHFAHSSDRADLGKAVHYGELAARRAMAVCAYGEAARQLEQAAEVQEVLDPGDRARWCDLLLALGNALMPAGQAQRAAEEIAEAAFGLAEHLGDRARAASACALALEALRRFRGRPVWGTPGYRLWSERFDRYALPGTAERVRADIVRSWVLNAEGRLDESWALCEQSLAAARQLDDPELLFTAASTLLLPTTPPQRLADQMIVAHEFTSRPRDGVSMRTADVVLDLGAGIYLRAGDRARAEQLWHEQEELASRSQDANLLIRPLQHAATRATLQGDLEGALEWVDRLDQRSEELGLAGGFRSWMLGLQPLIYLGRASDLAGKIMALSAEGLRVPVATLAHAGLAEAESAFTRAIERRDSIESGLSDLADLMEAAVLLRRPAEAAHLLPHVAGVVSAPGATIRVRNVARHVGDAAVLIGDHATAHRHYDLALEWATKIQFRPEIALTHLAMAELMLNQAVSSQPSAVSDQPPAESQSPTPSPQPPREALAHLDFAIEEFQAMKMQPSLERALRHKGLLHA